MKSWGVGTNSVFKTASIYLESAPFWAFWGRELTLKVCDLIPPISFPRIGRIVDEGEVYNFREYYGDLNSWWHVTICDPMYGWFSRFINTEFINIEYLTAKRITKKYCS